MKQVIDPESPISLFHIDSVTNRAIPPKSTPPVMSPFDENALEAALKIKDTEEAKVTVISMGRKLARAVVRLNLAAGADELILLEDDSFDDFNTYFTANVIAQAIKEIGIYDLILCGIQAADTNAGQVGTGIANFLGIPCITIARKIELSGDKAIVERALPDGFEVAEVQAPVVITTSYEIGKLRRPGAEGFMTAGKKPMTVWNSQQLGITTGTIGQVSIRQVYQPTHENRCEMIDGVSPEEKAIKLAIKLKEAKAI